MRGNGLFLGLTALATGVATPGGTVPISVVQASGYRGTAGTITGTDPHQPGDTFNVTRKGYDGSYTMVGTVPTPTLKTNILEVFTVRHLARNMYPADGSEPIFGPDGTFNDYVYNTDTVASATNSSTLLAPKATVGWAIADRQMCGDSLVVSIVAFQRNCRNRQMIPIAVFSASDGVNTPVYGVTTTSEIIPFPGGVEPIAGVRCEGYTVTFDLSGLNNPSDITVNCQAYPWVGDSASVADSSSSANQYEFAPLVFRRDTTKKANPIFAYVSSTGTDAVVDSAGVSSGTTKISTTAATARAAPFQTVPSAENALKAASTLTNGFTDGCEVRLMDAITWNTNATIGTYSQTAALTITRDPLSASRAAAALTISTAVSTRHQYLRFTEMSLVRGANVLPIPVSAGAKWIMENMDFDNGGFASTIVSSNWNVYWIGVNITNSNTAMWSPGSTPHLLIRGCTILSGTVSRPEAGVCIGNNLSGASCLPSGSATRQATRAIVAFNKMMSVTASGSLPIWAHATSNAVVAQNLVEYIGSTPQSIIHPSADEPVTYSAPGMIYAQNTVVGAYSAGRINFLYDNTIGTARDQRLVKVFGCVFPQWSEKTDYFIAANLGATALETALHSGAHNLMYAVGVDYIHAMWPDAASVGHGYDTFARRWAQYGPYTYGRNSSVPNSDVAENSPGFKNPKHTTYTGGGAGAYSGGLGGGDYRPKRISEGDASDSPLLSKITDPIFRFDIAGTARASSNDTIGCYA
jgi:hypothetical protein